MKILKRLAVIPVWFIGTAFIFAAANKNDPYLIALRGPGNIALVVMSLVALLVLIRRDYRNRPGISGNC